MSESAHQFQFGSAGDVCAVGPAAPALEELETAATGGDPVRTVFATDLSALTALRSAAAGDGSMWLTGTDTTTGLPSRYVSVGDNFLTLGVYVTDDGRSTLAQGTKGVDDLSAIGFMYLTLLTGATDPQPQVTQVMTGSVNYGGEGLPEFATQQGLNDLISGIVDKATEFVAGTVEEALDEAAEASSLADAGTIAGRSAAEVAAGTSGPKTFTGPGGTTVEADVGFTSGAVAGMVIGLVTLAALLPLTLLAKQMSAYVRLYNATRKEIDVSLCWYAEGNQSAGRPANDPLTLLPRGPAWTPPWIIGDETLHYASWVIGNTDTLKGVGYTLRLDPVDDFPGGNVVVDIPNTGANSLAVTFGLDEDCEAVWQAQKEHDTGLAASVTSGGYRMRIATNQTSGRSAAPADGTLGYQYEHIILVDEVSAD